MNLEHELRRALTRTDPPSGFDDRVLSRIAAGETAHLTTPRQRWSRAVLPLAASLMLTAGATYYMQHHHQRQMREAQAHTEQAARDVVLALQVASKTVAAAQAKVEEITRYEPTNDN